MEYSLKGRIHYISKGRPASVHYYVTGVIRPSIFSVRIGELQIRVRGEELVNKYKTECRKIVRSVFLLFATIVLVGVEILDIFVLDILWNFEQ